ncbi:MAG: hypothetical protein AB7F53_08660, partial [Nitrososphaeraceae archaeon]
MLDGHIDTSLIMLASWLLIIFIITIGISYIDFNKQFFILHVIAETNNKKDFNEEKDDKDKSNKDEKNVEIPKKDINGTWTKTDQDLITKYNYRNLVI